MYCCSLKKEVPALYFITCVTCLDVWIEKKHVHVFLRNTIHSKLGFFLSPDAKTCNHPWFRIVPSWIVTKIRSCKPVSATPGIIQSIWSIVDATYRSIVLSYLPFDWCCLIGKHLMHFICIWLITFCSLSIEPDSDWAIGVRTRLMLRLLQGEVVPLWKPLTPVTKLFVMPTEGQEWREYR